MLNRINDVVKDFVGSPWSLEDLEGFPISAFRERQAIYEEREKWYDGTALDETIRDDTGNEVELYPMRSNPIKTMVLQHAKILFGEVEDGTKPLVQSRFQAQEEGQKPLADANENAIDTILDECHGRSLYIENAIANEKLGGCIFRISYVPWEWSQKTSSGFRTYPIRVDAIDPSEFYAIPYASDKYRLQEAWIVKQISEMEAAEYGYVSSFDEDYYYVEHWTAQQYSIKINGVTAIRKVGNVSQTLEGKNRWGFIPIVYIPHIRSNEFWGESGIDDLKGIVKEFNLRIGDLGDAVNDDAHAYIAYRNVQGGIRVVDISGLKALDLGSNPGLTGNEPEPDILQVNAQKTSTVMQTLVDGIFEEFMNEAYMPAIAWGKDEGSQRSGLTLAMRFWPLISHVGTVRFFWTSGLNLMCRMIISMLAMLEDVKEITEDNAKLRVKQLWYPHLPRDREADVQEWVQRVQTMLGSVDNLLERSGDVEDIEDEKKLMLEWHRAIKSLEAELEIKVEEAKAEAQAKVFLAQAEAQRRMNPPQSDNQSSNSGGSNDA